MQMCAHGILVSQLLTYLSNAIGSSLLKLCVNLNLFGCFCPLTLLLLRLFLSA